MAIYDYFNLIFQCDLYSVYELKSNWTHFVLRWNRVTVVAWSNHFGYICPYLTQHYFRCHGKWKRKKSAWTWNGHLEFYSDYIVILFYCIFAVKWFLLYKCNVYIHIKYADVEQIHEICGTQGNTFSYCINTFISSKKCFLSALRHLRNNDSFLGI